MMYLPIPTYLLCLATAIYIATSLVVATVRWFHVCQKESNSVDYLYPGRRMMTITYALNAVLLPCLLHPNDDHIWQLAYDYFPLSGSYYMTLLLLSYFGGVKRWDKWKKPTWLLGLPVALLLLAEIGEALSGHHGVWSKRLHEWSIGVGILETVCCAWAVWKVLQWVKELKMDDFFSNTDDFPTGFAHRMCVVIGVITVALWTTTILHHPLALALFLLLLSVWAVLFLVIVLPSKRLSRQIEMAHTEQSREEEEPAMVEEADASLAGKRMMAANDSNTAMSHKVMVRIAEQVRIYIEEQRNYLKPHLTINDVSEHCDYSRTYVSRVVKNEFGGFYNYVNSLRLRHFDTYMGQHPMATQEEACSESGFSSRQAYYNAKKKLAGQHE